MSNLFRRLFGKLIKSSEADAHNLELEPIVASESIQSALDQINSFFEANKSVFGSQLSDLLSKSAIHDNIIKNYTDGQRVELIEYLIQHVGLYVEGQLLSNKRRREGNVDWITQNAIIESSRLQALMFIEWPKLLMRRRLQFTSQNAAQLITTLKRNLGVKRGSLYGVRQAPIRDLLKSIATSFEGPELPNEVGLSLRELRDRVVASAGFERVQVREKLLLAFDDLLEKGTEIQIQETLSIEDLSFAYEGPLTDEIKRTLRELPVMKLAKWIKFLRFALTADKPKPTKKFLALAQTYLDPIGIDDFTKLTNAWLDFALAMPRTDYYAVRVRDEHTYLSMFNGYLTPATLNLFRGIVHTRSTLNSEENVKQLEVLAWWATQTIPQSGPRAKPLALACFNALALMPDAKGIPSLTRLRAKIKRASVLKSLDKVIAGAASNQNVDIGILADEATPDFGLINGSCSEVVGTYTATITITAPGKSSLTWITEEGKEQRSIPQEVKTGFAEKLKEIKTLRKALNKETSAQRNRIEQFYQDQRIFSPSAFAKTFHGHPLLRWFSRKLIWSVWTADPEVTTSIRFVNNTWQNVTGDTFELTDEHYVRLWHPAENSAKEVHTWRNHCYEHELVQPFKQAFREVYILTPAEETTGIYSNRFAGHILDQALMSGLCRARSWQKDMLGPWDGGYSSSARLTLPAFGLRAEYFLELADADTTYIGRYVASDQVRFVEEGRRRQIEAKALVDVPTVAFSEVMRDCDLFVAMASVANDPNWADRGDRTDAHLDYWHNTSFGELSITAATRREVLEKLLPRLKIRKVTTLTEKFLVVKGTRRTYKIHLGSGNILMEPNDQYLCIVAAPPARSSINKLYIPFAGDDKLSLILSKAFLLAADDKIDDPTILRQL